MKLPKSFGLKYKHVIILLIVLWQFKYSYDTNQPRVNFKTTQLHATSTDLANIRVSCGYE